MRPLMKYLQLSAQSESHRFNWQVNETHTKQQKLWHTKMPRTFAA